MAEVASPVSVETAQKACAVARVADDSRSHSELTILIVEQTLHLNLVGFTRSLCFSLANSSLTSFWLGAPGATSPSTLWTWPPLLGATVDSPQPDTSMAIPTGKQAMMMVGDGLRDILLTFGPLRCCALLWDWPMIAAIMFGRAVVGRSPESLMWVGGRVVHRARGRGRRIAA
jgi:hypothetical protein